MKRYKIGPYFCYRILGLVCTESGKHFDDTWIEPVCMAGMTAKNGVLYFTNCHSQTAQENLTGHASKDAGVTWEKIADISQPASYSDIAVSPDGKKVVHLL